LVVHHIHPGNIFLHPNGLELVLLLVGKEVVNKVLQLVLVISYQAASVTASLIDALNIGPLCLLTTQFLLKISRMALNSTRPRHGTPLILYLGAEVMPKCPSKALSMPVGIGASALKDSILSTFLNIFSLSSSLRGEYPSSSSSSSSML
jgi:hypothetical protein